MRVVPSHLSDVVSIVHGADVFFIQNFNKCCHSPRTLGSTHSEAINIFLKLVHPSILMKSVVPFPVQLT